MEQKQACRMLFRKSREGGAALLRMYGASPRVFVPPLIAGLPCVEIAPYCFAGESRLFNEPYEEIAYGDGGLQPFLQELCKNAIEEVVLPDSVRTIGSCAFYNCRKLKTISMGAAAKEIGSDAFMNTISLSQIVLRCPANQTSGIQKMLGQISSDLEVAFVSGDRIEASLFYPDYNESYDEIAPAHLFGRNISGEGFRARQCFADGRVDFAGYDDVFLQACVEEPERTLSNMALGRLRHPYQLSRKSEERYQSYVREHVLEIADRMILERDLDALQFLCQEKLLGGANLATCIRAAAKALWPEGAAGLLREKAAAERAGNESRYDFDAF